MKAHPAADLFPMLSESELSALAEDIRANGQIEPIVVFDGMVLDGRNRVAACRIARVEPKVRTLSRCDSPTEYVISANLHRRHLTPIQRAAVAAKARPMFEAEARKRQVAGRKAGGKEAGRGRPKVEAQSAPKPIRSKDTNKSSHRAASAVGAGERATETLLRVQGQAPEVFALVEQGKVGTVADAGRLAGLAPAARALAVQQVSDGAKPTEAIRQARKVELAARRIAEPSGKYRVIYADPPWQYSDTRAGLGDYAQTAAADHYPTMATEAICDLPVKEWAESDAVLFCWATFPMLPDALAVVTAWAGGQDG